jgi:hypothetical protein
MNEVKLTGNQKRYLVKPKTRDIGNGTRLIFAYTDAELNTIRQLEALGLLKRYPSTSGFWELTDEGKELQGTLLQS